MSVFLRIDINIAAMILLALVVLIAYNHLDRTDRLNKAFLMTCFVILLELFFETTTCIINRRPELWLTPISNLLHVGLFSTAPILTYFWYCFICRYIAPTVQFSRQKKIILLIPVAFNFIITALSPLYAFVFSINSLNIYQRGPLFIVSAIIIYSYIVYSFILILKQKRKIVMDEFIPLLIFGVLPIIGGLLQTLFYGILLMWSCSAFSLIIVYIFLQQRMVHLDKLTGAWTRESFDNYISQRLKLDGHDRFGLIFVDIDGLKQINDTYGHCEGDFAIKTSVQLIKNALGKKGIIARAGGDEFFVILDCTSKQQLEYMMEKIDFCFEQYNKEAEKKYLLDCSFGAEIFDSSYSSIEQFLNVVDNLMYSNKNQKKVGSPLR